MAELLALVFSVATGIVLAGIVTNALEMVLGKRAGFYMLLESGKPGPALLVSGFLFLSGPLLLLRWGRGFLERREVAGVSVALTGAASWGFVTGMFALYGCLALTS
jgi:hypothetical protein